MRRVIRGIGKTLISVGVLLFLFVGYQLWGTNLAEARDQRSLEKQFSRFASPAPPATDAPAAPPTTVAPPVLGDAAALIEIPKISVQKYVVEGVSTEDLKKGPGHYPDTPMPGRAGNSAIAGHRTTYGAPFSELDKLNPGDPIFVTTPEGKFHYEVNRSDIVDPSQSEVLDDTPDNRLTLTTCHPRFSAAQRLIVVAKLISPVFDAPPPAATDPAPTDPGARAPDPAPRTEQVGLDAGLSGSGTANGPALAWGLLAAIVWGLTWWVSHWWRRWPTYLFGAALFLVALYNFFENVSRLLPANV
ncbi:MAG TPA: class E sortase [Acidimicrobiales bacterium]|nr:class E sortase [Acidimicrobiales bacterium]